MDKRLKMLTALTVIAIMTVAIVYASYWIYSNVVTVTSPKLTLDYTIESVSENLINATLVARVTPSSITGTVEFLNVTEGQVSIANVTLEDGAAQYPIETWNGTKYQARLWF
jgi:zona occludens toxin (predicted ATPase)